MTTQAERTAKLEVQANDIEKKVDDLASKMDTLIEKVDSNFVTKEEFKSYKQSQMWQKILIAVASMAIGSLLTYFFNTVGK